MSGHVSNPVKILLIDDDILSRELLTLLLTSEGYIIAAADSGEAALEQLRKMPDELPDAILIDLQMPGLSGSALAQKLRAACNSHGTPQTLLLAMSGSHPEDAIRRSFDEFLLKPFTMPHLAATLATGAKKPDSAKAANGSSSLPSASLNENIYRQLSESIPRQQLHQLYSLCISDIEGRIARMRTAVASGDDDSYRREAHAIKGGSGMVGATDICSLAADMEAQGIKTANHVASLNEMLPLCERLKVILIAR